MEWYLIILALLLTISGINYTCKNRRVNIESLSFATAVFILFFFMAFRGQSVGADTGIYARWFENVDREGAVTLKGLFISTLHDLRYDNEIETGYLLYNKLVRSFFSSQQAIIVANSIIIITLLYKIIKRTSPYPILSIWLYVTLGVFQTQMNMARNAMAIVICYFAMTYCIPKRQMVRYILLVLLAATFHFSTILFLPLYWVSIYFTWNRRKLRVFFYVVIGLIVFSAVLVPALSKYIPQLYLGYLYTVNSYESILVGLLNFFLFLFCIIFTDKGKRIKVLNECKIGTLMFFLNLVAFSVGYRFGLGARLAATFGPYVIIFLPQIIRHGIHSEKKREFVCMSVFFVSMLQYIFRLSINNIGQTMPYMFFWQ